MLANDSIPETARYYVYTLAYPDGTVFYVGKGTGARMDAHEKEARGRYTSKKCDIIRQIWAQGGQVMKTKVYQAESASDALQYEHDLILAYGLDSLANVKVEKMKDRSVAAERVPKQKPPRRQQPFQQEKLLVRLGIWRMRRGMTMKQLAEAAAVSEQTIVRIETHGVIPFPRTLDKLAKALNVSPEALLIEDDEPVQNVSETCLP